MTIAEKVTKAAPEVLATDVPGVVLWRYPARLFTVDGARKRSRYYSVTHEASGVAFLSGVQGMKVTLRRADADDIVAKMADLRWRGKPFDWTQPFEAWPPTAQAIGAEDATERVGTPMLDDQRAGWLRRRHLVHEVPGVPLDYEETIVLRNLLSAHNRKTDQIDRKMVALQRRLEAHMNVADVPEPRARG